MISLPDRPCRRCQASLSLGEYERAFRSGEKRPHLSKALRHWIITGDIPPRRPVRLVYPIPQEKWIVRLAADGLTPISRRKSPRRGRVEHLFLELVSFPELATQPNFSIEVLLTKEEEVWQDDKRGSWRRKGWSIADRRLVNIVASILLESPGDFLALLPPELPIPFTTLDLARALHQPRYLAQKMAYCLRAMGIVEVVGKRGNAWLYQLG